MAKKAFDLKKKTIAAGEEAKSKGGEPARPAGQPEMIFHEEAKPLGFWGRLRVAVKLGITWKDIVIYILLALVAFGLAVLVTRYLAGRQEKRIEEQQTEATPEVALPPVPETALEATPESKAAATPTVDKSSFKIRVLNGNGISGDAKKTASLLTDAGFQTGGIANAKGVYQTTQVWYLAGKQAEAESVEAELTKAGKEVETKEAEQAVIGAGFELLVITGVK